MTTARWRHQNAAVSMDSVNVLHAGVGVDIQLGSQVLWVSSEQHFDDLVAKVKHGFANLSARRVVPSRTDNVKPTDYSSVNCSGACYGGDDE